MQWTCTHWESHSPKSSTTGCQWVEMEITQSTVAQVEMAPSGLPLLRKCLPNGMVTTNISKVDGCTEQSQLWMDLLIKTGIITTTIRRFGTLLPKPTQTTISSLLLPISADQTRKRHIKELLAVMHTPLLLTMFSQEKMAKRWSCFLLEILGVLKYTEGLGQIHGVAGQTMIGNN